MNEIEQNLFGLMELAKEQQIAINTALVGLAKSKIELAQAAAGLQEYGKQIVQKVGSAASEGATQAVKAALENASQTAAGAVVESCQPLLAGLTAVTRQTYAAESKLKNAVEWLGWRLAAVVGAIAGVVILSMWMAVWWQRSQLDDLKAERDKISGEVAAAQSTLAALTKRTGGVRYVNASDGRFINVPDGFDAMTCVGNVPCIRLKKD